MKQDVTLYNQQTGEYIQQLNMHSKKELIEELSSIIVTNQIDLQIVDTKTEKTIATTYGPFVDKMSDKTLKSQLQQTILNKQIELLSEFPLYPSIHLYVDGAYDEVTKKIGAGLIIANDVSITKQSIRLDNSLEQTYNASHQIAGEIYATLKGIAYALERRIPEVHITYDYVGVERWVTGEWNAKSILSQYYLKTLEDLYTYYGYEPKLIFHKVTAENKPALFEQAETVSSNALNLDLQFNDLLKNQCLNLNDQVMTTVESAKLYR